MYLRSFPIHTDASLGDGATEATRARHQRRIALYGLRTPVPFYLHLEKIDIHLKTLSHT